MIRTLHLVRKDYQRNYRFHGGVGAAARCLWGSWRLRSGLALPQPGSPTGVDCITCSVIPRLTALWAPLIERAVNGADLRLIIGDCSGGLGRYLESKGSRTILPLLNHEHGLKLDLLLYKVCRSEFCVVSDDDVFWLNQIPWEWAMEQFHRDPKVAVVSLVPRNKVSSVLQGRVERPMGSSCLVLRRELWIRERLSFKIVHPAPEEGYDWFYDTADLANLELLRRGYKVVTAPQEITEQFAIFEAISAWLLKVQMFSAQQLAQAVCGIPLQQEKAMAAVLSARALGELRFELRAPDVGGGALVAPERLRQAEAALRQLVPAARVAKLESEVARCTERTRPVLRASAPQSTGVTPDRNLRPASGREGRV